jgi:curved DNA-binding protein CbpA
MADFYEVLCITRTATLDEIKKAYKKLAIKWHPDKNPDNQEVASERFKMIAEAYEVLSDPEKRRHYDRGGGDIPDMSGFSAGGGGGFRSGGGRSSFSRGFSDQRAFDIFNSFFADFEDFHQQAFGRFADHSNGFGNNPFFENGGSSRRADQAGGGPSGRSGRRRDPFDDPFFSDPFGGMGGGFGGGGMMGGGFGGMGGMGGMGGIGAMHQQMLMGAGFGGGFGGGAMSSFSSSSSSVGRGGMSRSVSTSTFIGPDGRKVTRTETTIVHPDGRRETNVEENVEEGHQPRLGNEGNRGVRHLVINRG